MSDEHDEPNSRAVVANGDHGGVVLWRHGNHIDHAMELWAGDLTDVGLDDAPQGVSVWEGYYTFHEPRGMEGDYDTDAEAHGCFRVPTDAEWGAIRRGESPWANDAPWWQEEAEVKS